MSRWLTACSIAIPPSWLTPPGKQPAAAVVAGQLPTPAAPDFPAALGWSIIGLYAAIMLDFTLFFTGSASAAFMVGVSIAYVVVYLSVPVAFMRIERTDQPRISLGRFLKEGVDTWTGHLSGREAIAQVLLIPAVLTIAIFLIGIAWQVAR